MDRWTLRISGERDTQTVRRPPRRRPIEAGDGRAVAGAGEAMGEAPILQRVGRRAPLHLNVCKNLDGGSNTRCRRHGSPSRMRTMKMIHMIVSTIAPAMKNGPRCPRRL